MKKSRFLLVLTTLSLTMGLFACKKEDKKPPEEEIPPIIEPIEETVLSVTEVLKKEDLTHVIFKGIVTGYDYGKRHMIIEDEDGTSAIQLYKNPGFSKAKVGDLVKVDGYRTYDKGVDRITPNSLDILSSGHKNSSDTPTVIDAADLKEWTNSNRTNPGILFKTYKFTNVEILEVSASYTYIDNQYDEIGGRGLKLGIKNDSSYCDISELKLVQGQKYNITAIAYGLSDDFKDENLDGTVIRLSVLSTDDVELVVENTEEATILVSGQRSFLLENDNDKPDFTTYFQVVDPIDGAVQVTNEMITENVDMKTAGTYPVTFTYQNSIGKTLTHTFEIYVTENGLSISEALKHIPEFIDLHVNGVVIGWQYNGSQRTATILEDPNTGEAVEIWTNNKSDFQRLEVGDHITVYSSTLGFEKEMPRLSGTVAVIKTLAKNVELTPVTNIEDVKAWVTDLANTKENFFGRYSFEAEFVETNGAYSYFLRADETTGNIIQLGLYQSVTSYDFVPGCKYKITAVATGISDSYSKVETQSIVMRLSIMNPTDIELVVGEEATVILNGHTFLIAGTSKPNFKEYFNVVDPVDGLLTITDEMITENVDMATPGEYTVSFTYTNTKGNRTEKTVDIIVSQYGLSVSEALLYKGQEKELCFHGYVVGYGVNDSGNYTAVIIQDTQTKDCIEFWANDHSNYRSLWKTLNVGDHIILHTDAIIDSKGLPRAGQKKNETMPIELNGSIKLSTDHLISPTEITDFEGFLTDAITNQTNILGRYTYTGSIENEYLYEMATGEGTHLRVAFYQSKSPVALETGKKYTITFTICGFSSAFDPSKDIDVRISVMSSSDVEEVIEIPDDADFTVSISGEKNLLKGTSKPDFTTYFTVVDATDGEIVITKEMITEAVDMDQVGTYEVSLYCLNSLGKIIQEKFEITIFDAMNVTDAMQYLNQNQEVYIKANVAGYSVDKGNHKAIILQDLVTTDCIEFWGSDSGAYQDVWNSYEVGDQVIVKATSIVDNKGLPRANKIVTPMLIHDSYKLSTGNEIKVVEIPNMDAFLSDAITNQTNILGVYTCKVTVNYNGNDSFYQIKHGENQNLNIQFYQTVCSKPTVEQGKTYTLKFVIVGFNKAYVENSTIYIRATIMETTDVVEAVE